MDVLKRGSRILDIVLKRLSRPDYEVSRQEERRQGRIFNKKMMLMDEVLGWLGRSLLPSRALSGHVGFVEAAVTQFTHAASFLGVRQWRPASPSASLW